MLSPVPLSQIEEDEAAPASSATTFFTIPSAKRDEPEPADVVRSAAAIGPSVTGPTAVTPMAIQGIGMSSNSGAFGVGITGPVADSGQPIGVGYPGIEEPEERGRSYVVYVFSVSYTHLTLPTSDLV